MKDNFDQFLKKLNTVDAKNLFQSIVDILIEFEFYKILKIKYKNPIKFDIRAKV